MFNHLILTVIVYLYMTCDSYALQVSSIKGSVSCNGTGVILTCNNIPEDVPQGFSTVVVMINDMDVYCNNTSFRSSSWLEINTLKLIALNWVEERTITLGANCFSNLKNLNSLSINIQMYGFHLSPDALIGLPALKTLSLSDCSRLNWDSMQAALDGNNKVPNINDLDLTRVSIYADLIIIDNDFVDVLCTRNITQINLTGLQVSFMNCTSLLISWQSLQHLNMSDVSLNKFVCKGKPQQYEHIKELDVSNMTLPKSVIHRGNFKFYNVQVKLNSFISKIQPLFLVKSIKASGTFKAGVFGLFNCELILENYIKMVTETLIVSNNNFKYIDVKVSGNRKFRTMSIKHFDFSYNGMEFLHPAFLTLMPNLTTFNLARNKLQKMLTINATLFESLFVTNTKLQVIDLSDNGLEFIPTKTFMNNNQLEEIILSDNKLQQIQWIMVKLTALRILDLRNNRIMALDAASLKLLDNFVPSGSHLTLNLKNNPIMCSKCEDKQFITWLMETTMIDLTMQRLTCVAENGNRVDIEKSVETELQSICKRTPLIIACSTVVGAVFICSIISRVVLNAYRKKERRHQLLINIQQGEGQYEFVAMVSYFNQEEEFIRQYVLEQLNTALQAMTGVDRNLVLTGDQHFRPGHMVNNEIASSLERVCVILLLITDEFCSSIYCLSELDQAWIQCKPMIFMFKDDVDENLMTPIMKTIYKNNVRILWTKEDDEYVLKTTWENVCDAILELILK